MYLDLDSLIVHAGPRPVLDVSFFLMCMNAKTDERPVHTMPTIDFIFSSFDSTDDNDKLWVPSIFRVMRMIDDEEEAEEDVNPLRNMRLGAMRRGP
jgi:hypothetical protein